MTSPASGLPAIASPSRSQFHSFIVLHNITHLCLALLSLACNVYICSNLSSFVLAILFIIYVKEMILIITEYVSILLCY
jgi:hypothetical protein